jgi:hypothetical protein
MERVGEHPVPAGPLAVRWLGHEVPAVRAGEPAVARVLLENAGSAPWRSRGREGVQIASHWLDALGNPIVWDGERTAFAAPVRPGEHVEADVRLLGPRPPGAYRLAVDLVEEHRFWFAEVGSHVLEVPVDVGPRIEERRLAVRVHGGDDPETKAALAAQEEPLVDTGAAAVAYLVAGALPPPDWSRRLLDAHEEGWAAVGPALVPNGGPLERRRAARRLAPWSAPGRNPRLGVPLLLPSLVGGLEPAEHEGLPAWAGGDALYDGRIRVRLRLRPGRPPA